MKASEDPLERRCTTCGEIKPLEAFAKKVRGKHGRRAYCKPCGVKASVAWQQENREKARARQARWYLNNAEQAKAAIEKWRLENPEKQREATRAWGIQNKDRRAATLARRRAAKMKRTPAWLTKADHREMELFYVMARALSDDTGVAYHVDHILPLQGEFVSGLHVPANLQILSATENMSKANKWVPE